MSPDEILNDARLISAFKFRGHSCFKNDWAGFDEVKPINVIIGRNNTGKSQLLDLVKSACKSFNSMPDEWELRLGGVLDESSIRESFSVRDGLLPGNDWQENAMQFLNLPVAWERRNLEVKNITLPSVPAGELSELLTPRRRPRLQGILSAARNPLSGKTFRHLLADRDIQVELGEERSDLFADGRGATNLIRRLNNSYGMPSDLLDLVRTELNRIFGSDGEFTSISVRQYDVGGGDKNGKWEVFLTEPRKGQVSLSNSGSGLKTILLVLLNLLVIPKLEKSAGSQYVFAFEELENNLHPALLRRLLRFIEEFAERTGCTVFITTHSSVALDLFGPSSQAQLVHVTHDGQSGRVEAVRAHFERMGVVGELGARPSDLLQANGVIWVEGPSDIVLVSRWIELISNGELRVGRDYAFAFYGGALLSHLHAREPDGREVGELVSLLLLNRNIAVICDGDRSIATDDLKGRVRRIVDEVRGVPGGFVWVTAPKEIEAYLPGSLIARALGVTEPLRDPVQFEKIFASTSPQGDSYFEAAGKVRIDKVEFARECAALMTTEDMTSRFDWRAKIEGLVGAIRGWNA